MLEPYEAQVSSTVLRGWGGSNTSLLPGLSVSGSSQRGRVCARPDPAGRCGAKEQWPVASGQWSVNAKRGDRGGKKAPEQSQFAQMLVVDRLLLRANEGGIERENEPDFRREGVRGERREARALRDNVVNYVCRDRADHLWQFGMGSRPARRRGERAVRGCMPIDTRKPGRPICGLSKTCRIVG